MMETPRQTLLRQKREEAQEKLDAKEKLTTVAKGREPEGSPNKMVDLRLGMAAGVVTVPAYVATAVNKQATRNERRAMKSSIKKAIKRAKKGARK